MAHCRVFRANDGRGEYYSKRMNKALRLTQALFYAALSAAVGCAEPTLSPDSSHSEIKPMTMQHASGIFEVELAQQKSDNPPAERAKHGRMSIDKRYHGDLEGDGAGEMLSAMTQVQTSGVYVAIERVTAKLHGRTGSFLLHHTGLATRGAQQLRISVVPDSGEGELEGISGTMNIRIEQGRHYYDFEYTISAQQ